MSNRSRSLLLLLLTLAGSEIIVPALAAKTHCPGNVGVLPFRVVLGYLIIVPVVVNHTGPYDFLLDTGTQVTMVDSSLAATLKLKTQGTAEVVGIGFRTNASVTRIDLVEIGSQSIANDVAEVLDLRGLQRTDVAIRGILGGASLQSFDLLMDYTHNVLCLDSTKVMRKLVKGVRVDLAVSVTAATRSQLTGLLLIPVYLSGAGGRRLLLALDSGTNVPFLYDPGQFLTTSLLRSELAEGKGEDGVNQPFAVLRPQTMRIGSLEFQEISFLAPARTGQVVTSAQVDGILPTTIFRRVFVSYSEHFAVLDSR